MSAVADDPRMAGPGKPAPLHASERKHAVFITVSIMLATIMQTLDSTIANVALPHMAGSLSASQDQISWVLTSYIVAAAIATPLTGWLSTRFGRKRVFLVSVVGFTVASMWCGLSTTLVEIVLARLLQGLFGAALVPLSQAVMIDSSAPEKRGQAMAIWGMGVMIGPILGPTLGGWLTDNLSWRWVFFINLPVGMLSYYGIKRYIAETTVLKQTKFDFYGFVTLSLAIGLLQMFLDRGELLDWLGSTEIVVEMVGALIAFVFFVALTATAGPVSFFNRNLLKDRNFAIGLGLYFMVGLLLYATRALLPPMLQTLMGYPAVEIGMVTAPSGLGTMLTMLIAGRLVNRVDSRVLIGIGFGLTAISLWQMSGFNFDLDPHRIIVSGFVQGMGIGFVSVPLTTVSFSTLDARLRPDGTAIFSLFRNIGSSIGISVMETLTTRNAVRFHSQLAENVNIANPAVVSGLPPAYDLSTMAGAAALNAEVTRQASFIAYLNDFRIMMLATLVVLPLLLLMRQRRST
jgi:MFS transporter, DHA2 family, multidrug resistance protein